jgi:hypothetical protein
MLRKTLLGLIVILIAGPAIAQVPAPVQISEVDAGRTRDQLRELLHRHPSEVGTVLGLSPSLLRNEVYMASYPALQAFVGEHPEVVHNPGFFFGGYAPMEADPRTPTLRFWEDFLFGLTVFLVFVIVSLVLAWLVKTLLEQRRWSHQARVQAEVHNKVLDRLASNEQLLAYIETPAGRRFLESAPIPLEGPRPMSAPVGRVLWSMQAGLVLVAAGVGLLLVSLQMPVGAELPLRVLGVATLSIGIGFVVSAGASFFLARRLGLWEMPASSTE